MPCSMMVPKGLILTLLLWTAGPSVVSANFDTERNSVKQFIAETAESTNIDADSIRRILRQAEHRQDIIDAISRPAEAMPWHRYRPIFMREDRITDGVAFWAEHEDSIRQAADRFGVSESVIVAIIGVETRYGEHTGRYRVIDALTTLGFSYPPRGDFFRRELAQYLLLAEEEGFDPLVVRGSYAGAMGIPQFISSSYRHYAVDGDGDGRRDLMSNTTDAVASVANYFNEHRWRRGQPVVSRATPNGDADKARIEELANKGRQPYTTVGELRAAGMRPQDDLDDSLEAILMELDGENGTEYWIGLHNFYVITRYNHSPLYALAVWQLSEAIRSQRDTHLESDT